MTRNKAIRILGLHNDCTKDDIKKKYRMLMKQIHPDITSEHDYPYDASDINTTYELLMNDSYENITEEKTSHNRQKSSIRWNAPINNNAFCERDIYHNVEDADGTVIGQAVLDCGKYVWSPDEEFNLFLKSLYECSKRIISEDDENKGRDRSADITLQAEIMYLLAQQYVDSDMMLNRSSLVGKINDDTFLIDAMVEDIDFRMHFKEGEYLLPGRLHEHVLFLNNEEGKEVGYLSFRDDRLYYGIIPLFERRAVQLKIQIADGEPKRQRGKRYIDISLMMRCKKEDKYQIIENINSKIIELLHE